MRRRSELWSEPFIRIEDDEGRRHIVRIGHINALSDTDPLQNETFVKLGSQVVRVPEPLDTVLERVLGEDE